MVLPQPKKEFVFSPSSLTDWERRNKCIAKWHSYWVNRSWKRPDTYYTRIGRYFEYLCLGKSPHDTDPITSPDINASGDIPIAYKRAQEQSEIFLKVFTPGTPEYLGEKIIHRHLKLTSKGSPKMRGIIDFVTQNEETGRETIWDLKLTASNDSKHGYQPWGNIEDIDPIQLGSYKIIYEEEFGKKVFSKYALFEHGPMKKRSIITMNIDEAIQTEINERYQTAYSLLDLAKTVDFEVYQPSVGVCHDCPLKCPKRMTAEQEEYID